MGDDEVKERAQLFRWTANAGGLDRDDPEVDAIGERMDRIEEAEADYEPELEA